MPNLDTQWFRVGAEIYDKSRYGDALDNELHFVVPRFAVHILV